MVHKDFIRLMGENVLILGRLSDQLKVEPGSFSKYSKQQLAALVRLHVGGRAKLKDIAQREFTTAPNLCATFRKLERDGMVMRTVDEADRRNTWYSVTPAGAVEVKKTMEKLRETIATVFSGLSDDDEKKLVGAMKTVNEVLTKMEKNNA